MAVDIYVKFFDYTSTTDPAIKGESLKEGRENSIEAHSVGWSTNLPVQIGSASSGAGSSKVEFGELRFTKNFDRTSPVLFLYQAQGKAFKSVSFTFSKAGADKTGAQDFAILTLGAALISTIETNANIDDVPQESIGLTYGTLVWQIATAQGPSAKATLARDDPGKGWNRVKNKGSVIADVNNAIRA